MFLTDSKVNSVVIAGAGGFGREIFDYLVSSAKDGEFVVAGFIDDTPGMPVPPGTDVPHLGTIDMFSPQEHQAVVVAVGTLPGRRKMLERLWNRDAWTPAYIAENAIVSPAAKIERGVIVCPFSIINRDATLGEGAAVNVHCSVGHGASVGAFSILSPYVALNGDALIGSECFLGTRATIYPKVHVGNGAVVDTHAAVRANAPDNQMISSRSKYLMVPLRKTIAV